MKCGLPVDTARKLSVSLPDSVHEICRKLAGRSEKTESNRGLAGAEATAKRRQNGVEIITRLDESYPDMLKSTPQAPWVLYAMGNIHLLNEPGLAMVGTRIPTAYGRKVGSMLAEELCRAGLTIVSGMARGIDSVVHDTALRFGGKTIAVLGSGIDIVYPSENRSLYEEIAKQGLIISEYPPGTKALPGFFPQRNRIIAGLALGTLVVEADVKSGSLITADAALEAGRDVYAVPGPITSPKSQGTLNLIKQGAKPVTCAEDVTEEYRWRFPLLQGESPKRNLHGDNGMIPTMDGLTNDEMKIYHMLEQGPGTLDEILERTRWDFGHLHSVLLSLIIKKQITQLPGAIYKLI
ncbi:DNA-processing protein DprA [Paenibacillus sp. DMB20]|uniref:DNA-processing protein DprA n=1 Tax=Paenibacillus sp. DMB20 TaxID=1642570 RepID=UPI000AFD7A03|nr:DNA-processing protein DprA [Paenibacillus sp. DMB20]